MGTSAVRVLAVVAMIVLGIAPRSVSRARACSSVSTPAGAIPRPGSTNVSTATSVVIASTVDPRDLRVLVNGAPAAVSRIDALGAGWDEFAAGTNFWRVVGIGSTPMLTGNAEYVVSLTAGDGTTSELTRFNTAAGYDKVPGTPPVFRSARLWRVRYPVADISSGNCVFAEYHGFVSVEYDPATVPNSAPSSVVHTFRLAPKTGGAAQTFVFAAAEPFAGLAPAGDYPLPIGEWQPELDPTREYCLTVTASGDGDLARPSLVSAPVCVEVTQLSAKGAPSAPGAGGCSAGGWVESAPSCRRSLSALLVLLLVVRARRAQRGGGCAAQAARW